jgi:hypothetical protein
MHMFNSYLQVFASKSPNLCKERYWRDKCLKSLNLVVVEELCSSLALSVAGSVCYALATSKRQIFGRPGSKPVP